MAKDPAFLFYSSDFLNGVSDLTMEERGQYITLLCIQHQKGELTEKTICLTLGSVSVDVLSKFTKLENGNLVNLRLIEETEKRNNYTESRRNNGSKGGRPKKTEVIEDKPYAKPYVKATTNHIEDENESIFIPILSRSENFYNQCLKDQIWKEAIFMQKVLNPSNIEFALKDYNIHLTQQGENKNSLKDYKSHFVNWVKKKKELKAKEVQYQNKDRL